MTLRQYYSVIPRVMESVDDERTYLLICWHHSYPQLIGEYESEFDAQEVARDLMEKAQ